MKVKLFVKDKSSFRSWGRYVGDLEAEINAWLAAHPDIRIVHLTQSSNGGSFDTSKVFVSIWYEEGAQPDISAWPREPGASSPHIKSS